MAINFSVLKLFQFEQTIKMLQRGEQDPINIISEKIWTRLFRLPNNVVLIRTQQKKGITSEILLGTLSDKKHRLLVSETLGLDDPIFLGEISDIPYVEKIQDTIGIAMPGYPDLFEAIVQIIMGQQVSVIVANKIRAKFTNQFGGHLQHEGVGYRHFPHPEQIVDQSVMTLRSLGLSQTKCKSILGVAKAFYENEVMQKLNHQSSSEFIRNLLTELYGVGDWTVDWLLLRGFRRFEIIPNTDLAVRKAMTWWLNKKTLMSAEAIKRYEGKLYPYGGVIAYRVLTAYSQALRRKLDV